MPAFEGDRLGAARVLDFIWRPVESGGRILSREGTIHD